MAKKTLISWSSGKDSAWALHTIRKDPRYDVLGLFSTYNTAYNRVAMHGTRVELVSRQAERTGLPIRLIGIPDPCTDQEYAAIMSQFVKESAERGIECMVFGDLFLEDIRTYRERQLAGTGIEPLFPLWGIDTRTLASRMLDSGVEAFIASMDLAKLDPGIAGAKWSKEMIDGFPPRIDPCGENGEYHTAVCAGPMFDRDIQVTRGEVVIRNGYAYADFLLTETHVQ